MSAAPKMGPRTAEALRLSRLGLTYREIGVRMGIKKASVGTLVFMARAHQAGRVKRPGRPNGMGPQTARAWRLTQAGLAPRQVGRRMHLAEDRVAQLLKIARRHLREQELRSDYAQMLAVSPCTRCGLRGPHECLAGSDQQRPAGNLAAVMG